MQTPEELKEQKRCVKQFELEDDKLKTQAGQKDKAWADFLDALRNVENPDDGDQERLIEALLGERYPVTVKVKWDIQRAFVDAGISSKRRPETGRTEDLKAELDRARKNDKAGGRKRVVELAKIDEQVAKNQKRGLRKAAEQKIKNLERLKDQVVLDHYEFVSFEDSAQWTLEYARSEERTANEARWQQRRKLIKKGADGGK